ncbi:hypothetical protein [Actinopolyspora saharensis]|uniref:Uncharacterized protein n=1 Tax=Actinopolyspora saharensis TaxID=995062 RepID=A0A1H1F2N8_9ACTN|nr:hypothetical protein [Actinopolyspora saharensis]SDQ95034.1 hypothetical protein SAMN04489718_2799 [Actinopolyspora saharensis]
MSEQKQKYKVVGAVLLGFGVLAFVVLNLAVGLDADDDSPTFWDDESSHYYRYENYNGLSIPRFSSTDSENLSQGLNEYEQQYGICFGWKLTDGTNDAEDASSDRPSSYDQGSSRGPNTPADVCDRWVELRVIVAYTSSTSDDWSAVDLEVAKSPGLSLITPSTSDFAELGIDAETFIESPVDTTGHAALSLPLLLAQNNADFEIESAESSEGTAPQQSLPPADNGPQGVGRWIWMSLLGLVTVVAVVLGIRGVRRERTAQSGQAPPPQAGNAEQQPPQGGGEQGHPPQQPPQQPPQNQWPGQQGPPQQWGPPPQGPPQQPPQQPPQAPPPQWGQPPQQPPDNPQWPPQAGPPGQGPQQ